MKLIPLCTSCCQPAITRTTKGNYEMAEKVKKGEELCDLCYEARRVGTVKKQVMQLQLFN